MNISDITTWVATASALILGIRAEMRSKKLSKRDELQRLASATTALLQVFRESEKTFPDVLDSNLLINIINKQESIYKISTTAREITSTVAAAFEHAGRLLELADNSEELLKLAEAARTNDSLTIFIFDSLAEIYNDLGLLSISYSTWIRLSGKEVTLETIDRDRFVVTFKSRHLMFFNEYWRRRFALHYKEMKTLDDARAHLFQYKSIMYSSR